MDENTSLRYQLISAWCGPAFLVTFVFFWGILGHNLPNGWAQATWNFFSRYMPKVIPQ